MAVKVAINGFGRIGRLVFRALVEQGMVGKDIEVVAVGDIVPADNLAYLLKYDSIQGRFNGNVASKASPDAVAKATAAGKKAEDADPDILVVNGKEMKVVSAKSPAELPWKAMGVELVIESTGLFTASRLSWASTMANTIPSNITSFPTPPAPRIAWPRLFMCCSRKDSASRKG